MQTSLMFVDLKPLGVTPDSQKIAIKMPKGKVGTEAENYAGFSDIISALMAATPEQLQHSLERMEWVKVQGDAAGYAPLIDLSAVPENGAGMVQMLNAAIGPNNSAQTGRSALTPHPWANPEGQEPADVEGKTRNTLNRLLLDTSPETPKEGPSQTRILPEARQRDDGIPSQIIDKPGNRGVSGEIKIAGQDMVPKEKFSPRQYNPVPNVPETKRDETNLDLPQTPLKQHVFKEQAQNMGSDRNSLPAAATIADEMITKEIKNNEPQISKLTASQNHTVANIAADSGTAGQQSADDNGNHPEAQQFMKNETKEHEKSELSGQNFRPAYWEGSNDTSIDPQELLTGGKTDSRTDIQAMASRMKIAPDKGVEFVSGNHDPSSTASDPQSNVIRQIVQRMTLHTQGLQSSMTVKLKPEFLGNVHMQISTDNQQVVVRMATESLAVKEMVEQGLQHLKTELQHHGLEIDKFDVFVSDDKEGSRPGQDLAGFRQALKERRKGAHMKDSGNSPDGEDNVDSAQKEHGRTANPTSEIDYFA